MNFYYVQGSSGTQIYRSPLFWYFGVALMALIVVGISLVAGAYIIRKWREKLWGWCDCTDDMTDKVVVITGANCGIGLETARALAERGATVVLACRSAEKALKAIHDITGSTSKGKLVFLELDLANTASIERFASRLLEKFKRVDILINNAGIYFPAREIPITDDKGNEIHFAVNHLGHFLLTHLLTDAIIATENSRIIVVSSELYIYARLDLDDIFCRNVLQYARKDGQLFYRNSKMANMLHAKELHRRLKGHGVRVCALSPGFVCTGLFRQSLQGIGGYMKKLAFLPLAFFFMRSAAQGAQTSIHCAVSKEIALEDENGSVPYYRSCKKSNKPVLTTDSDSLMAIRLWDYSIKQINNEKRV